MWIESIRLRRWGWRPLLNGLWVIPLTACSSDDGMSDLQGKDPKLASDSSISADVRGETQMDAQSEAFNPADSTSSVASCPVQASYFAQNYEKNVVVELDLRKKLDALISMMKSVETDPKNKRTSLELTKAFEAKSSASSPSLKEATAPAYWSEFTHIFESFETATGNVYLPSDPPPAKGGKLGDWIFDEKGLHLREIAEKEAFVSLFYHRAALALEAELPLETISQNLVDRIVAGFGANPLFLGDANAKTDADVHVAAYAEQRDPKDETHPGIYLKFKSAAITARAYAGAKNPCSQVAKDAAKEMMALWEKAFVATSIYYLQKAGTEFGVESSKASALHSYSEAIGFLWGLRSLGQHVSSFRVIKEAELDALLSSLLAPFGHENNEKVTSYELYLGSKEPSILFPPVISQLAKIYGFSSEDLNSFKNKY